MKPIPIADHPTGPRPEAPPPSDWVLVPKGPYQGVYVQRTKELTRTEQEKLLGFLTVHGCRNKLILADETQWAIAIGLVVCGLAERVQL